MTCIVVVPDRDDWPLELPDVRVVTARDYCTDPAFGDERGTIVFNCARSYRYQSKGYYVSLLAAARGHRVLPDVATIESLRSSRLVRLAGGDLDTLLSRSLANLRSDRFELDILFGSCAARRHEALAKALFNAFPAPFLRAVCVRDHDGWTLKSLKPFPASEIPPALLGLALEAAQAFFAKRTPSTKRKRWRYDLAILQDPEAEERPTDQDGIDRMLAAGRRADVRITLIGPDDLGDLGTFDALWIRATTAVNHWTFRFAQEAEARGLAVIDDPESIIRCTNKVFLAELMERNNIPVPPTLVVHDGNRHLVASTLGLPCVLKKPDSGFSQGVHKADSEEAIQALLDKLLDDSDFVIAQAFVPTEFDWRIGVLDRKPLWACRYHMAKDHWQIIKRDPNGQKTLGRFDTLALKEVPEAVLRHALAAANLIGDGLYGVDVKSHGEQVSVIEVNDNPNLDGDVEDLALGDKLWDVLISSFIRRIEARRNRR